MKKILIALTFSLSAQAQATDIIINWTPPSANTDGSTPASYDGFNLFRGPTLPLTLKIAGGSDNPITKTTLAYTDKNVPPGNYYYAISAWHCESAGCTESIQTISGLITVKATASTPGVPGSITITINGVKLP